MINKNNLEHVRTWVKGFTNTQLWLYSTQVKKLKALHGFRDLIFSMDADEFYMILLEECVERLHETLPEEDR